MYLVRYMIMRHISSSPFADHTFCLDRRSKLEISKNLVRMYTDVLEEPLPSALQRIVEKMDLGRSALGQAKVAAI